MRPLTNAQGKVKHVYKWNMKKISELIQFPPAKGVCLKEFKARMQEKQAKPSFPIILKKCGPATISIPHESIPLSARDSYRKLQDKRREKLSENVFCSPRHKRIQNIEELLNDTTRSPLFSMVGTTHPVPKINALTVNRYYFSPQPSPCRTADYNSRDRPPTTTQQSADLLS